MAKATSKFKNVRSGGFDSKKERRRYNELLLLQRAGKIHGLNRQVRFPLIPAGDGEYRHERPAFYTADFTYWENGKFVVEDVKSSATREDAAYILRRKLMLERYGYSIRET